MSDMPDGGARHLVAVANFYGPRSGGLRTALREIGRGYLAAGHRSTLVVPGEADTVTETDAGTVHTVAAPLVPGAGGYRAITRVGAVKGLLERLQPDRIELSDRSTLHGLGRWATARGVPCLFVAHERLDGVLQAAGIPPRPARALADARNRATAASIPTIVATTGFAAEEFERIGVTPHRVPLGVDLEQFAPVERPPNGRLELVLCSRLSREKRPDLAVATLRELRRRGVDARLTVAGHGPARARLERAAAGLPVQFLGYEADRSRLRAVLSGADVVLAPGPIETFGLAALEAMACGTPVVVNASSALPEVVGTDRMAGLAAPGDASAFADAVQTLAVLPLALRRAAARRRALAFPWQRSVDGLLELDHVTTTPAPAVTARPGG